MQLFLHPLELFEVGAEAIRAELKVLTDLAQLELEKTLEVFLSDTCLILQLVHSTEYLCHLVLDLFPFDGGLLGHEGC